jgi:hypothetical protein
VERECDEREATLADVLNCASGWLHFSLVGAEREPGKRDRRHPQLVPGERLASEGKMPRFRVEQQSIVPCKVSYSIWNHRATCPAPVASGR